MKKIKILLSAIIIVCVFGFIACGGSNKPKQDENQKNIQTTDTTGAKG